VNWTGDTATQNLLTEERTFQLLTPPNGAYALIETESRLTAVAGDTLLDGDPEHAGLHFRPTDATNRADTVYYFPKADANAHRDKDFAWVGMTFTASGKTFSVVQFNHPGNPTGTLWSAYRNYGRFGAFYKATIPEGKTLTIRARFLICAGEMPPVEVIQRVANEFSKRRDSLPTISRNPAEQSKKR
jgi:hypothetical protein